MPPAYCAAYLSPDGCSLSNCPRRHNIFHCICGAVVALENTGHRFGRRHREALEIILREDPDSVPPSETRKCRVCNEDIVMALFRRHSRTHERQRLDEIQIAFADAELDKGGITVSDNDGLDFGVVDTSESPLFALTIAKTDPEDCIALRKYGLSSSLNSQTVSVFSLRLVQKSRWIKQSPRILLVQFQPTDVGSYEDTVELIFHDVKHDRQFAIIRRLSAIVGSREDQERLQPEAPYVRPVREPLQPEGELVPSLRPTTWTESKFTKPLPKFSPPEQLIEAVYGKDGRPSKAIAVIRAQFMPDIFNEKTYTKYFTTMLHIEDEKMKRDLEGYAMEAAQLKAEYPRYQLEIAGLEEGRPSVIVGDFIHVKHSDSTDDKWYEGRVHHVYERYVSLQFHPDFSTYKGTAFDVRFVLNLLPSRRMHNALHTVFKPPRVLFPSAVHIQGVPMVSQRQIDNVTPVNRLIREDFEQLQAIATILNQRPGSVPFVVYGPPGTGKSSTIVEAIRQLLIVSDTTRIMVCAPSNSAADLLALKLIDLGPSQLFRLNALSRKYQDLSPALANFSLCNENKVFAMPLLEDILRYRVVVSTCISAGAISGLAVKQGHFSHIFIDEAGQAKEPEAMIPIKTLAGDLTNIVLAGDPKQLGPVIFSPIAAALGLKLSYLARIMARDIYDTETGRGITIVKLLKNFRSHAAILHFADKQFYNGELIVSGNPVVTESLTRSEELVTKLFPVVFHGIVGKDQREKSSPSFFNIEEASQVKTYCANLLNDRKHRLRGADIGVIAPYHAQCCKIQKLLRAANMQDVKVGSVEEFQGQERRVIILSMTRSTTDYMNADIRHNLGFVANPRRFNVAITRAQSLLIVIGNPNTLSLDPLLRDFLEYVRVGGGWRGKKLDWQAGGASTLTAGLDEQMRARAQADAQAMVERLRSLISIVERADGYQFGEEGDIDSDEELEAHMERPAHRRDYE